MGSLTIKTKSTIEQEALESAKQQVRSERDKLLRATDYLVMPDYPNKPTGIDAYRQALRDIPEQSGFPEAVDWPELPNGVSL